MRNTFCPPFCRQANFSCAEFISERPTNASNVSKRPPNNSSASPDYPLLLLKPQKSSKLQRLAPGNLIVPLALPPSAGRLNQRSSFCGLVSVCAHVYFLLSRGGTKKEKQCFTNVTRFLLEKKTLRRATSCFLVPSRHLLMKYESMPSGCYTRVCLPLLVWYNNSSKRDLIIFMQVIKNVDFNQIHTMNID